VPARLGSGCSTVVRRLSWWCTWFRSGFTNLS